MGASALGVVIPAYNEANWLDRSLAALREAATRADWELDVVVVDDGSTDGTAELLDGLESRGLRVIHQPNSGRFKARLAGLAALTTDAVLLLDARVLIDPDALRFLRSARDTDETARVWNGHVEVVSDDNPYGAFWSGITKIGWRAYFSNPRAVRFGLADFNSYPKGTGMFLAPRELLLDAAHGFSSMVGDLRLASDDTGMLREIARVEEICLAPGFSCRYHGRNTFKKWASQGYFRGTTFVDGYLGDSRRAEAGLATLAGGTAAGVALVLWRPRWALAAVAIGSAIAGGATWNSGGTRHESWSVARLVLPFAGVFGAGLFRGLWLVRRARERSV